MDFVVGVVENEMLTLVCVVLKQVIQTCRHMNVIESALLRLVL